MSTRTPTDAVVVGIDGSSQAWPALDIAADEATRLGKPLEIVHAYAFPAIYAAPVLIADASVENDLVTQAQSLLRDAAKRVADRFPDLPVTTEVVADHPAQALIAASKGASVLVLGSRGLGGFKGLIVGSVTMQVSARAHAPVLVVPADSAKILGPVIVGIDGSDAAETALGRAYAHAQSRQSTLVVVHAWNASQSDFPWDPVGAGSEHEHVQQVKERAVSEALAGWQDTYPDVKVERRVVRDHPANALLNEANLESLIVVGSRGRGGFRGLLLGSISQPVLHHASCAVEIVH